MFLQYTLTNSNSNLINKMPLIFLELLEIYISLLVKRNESVLSRIPSQSRETVSLNPQTPDVRTECKWYSWKFLNPENISKQQSTSVLNTSRGFLFAAGCSFPYIRIYWKIRHILVGRGCLGYAKRENICKGGGKKGQTQHTRSKCWCITSRGNVIFRRGRSKYKAS